MFSKRNQTNKKKSLGLDFKFDPDPRPSLQNAGVRYFLVLD